MLRYHVPLQITMLKSFKGAAQDFLLGILALYVKSQESIWDARDPGVQMVFH